MTRDDLLGTVVTLTAYGDADEAALESAFRVIEDIDARMSANAESSEIFLLNRQSDGAKEDGFAVSRDIYDLTKRAAEISGLSAGAFDPALGGVTELWKANGEFASLPSEEEILSRIDAAHFQNILFLPGSRIAFAEPGVKLDLGGIAKGYACDKAVASLAKDGAKSALLDLGGNIYALGKKPGGSDWKVGIAVPYAGESGVACSIPVTDRAVVTSGGYQRFFEKDGQTYHHILDPATGYPAESDLLSATVIGRSSADADGFSTACFVLGRENGMALIESVPGYEAILIAKDERVYATPGIAGQIEILDERFRLEET